MEFIDSEDEEEKLEKHIMSLTQSIFQNAVSRIPESGKRREKFHHKDINKSEKNVGDGSKVSTEAGATTHTPHSRKRKKKERDKVHWKKVKKSEKNVADGQKVSSAKLEASREETKKTTATSQNNQHSCK